MQSSNFVYLDVRWREDGWHEAMRFRLAGWLPEPLVARGVEKGVLQTIQRGVEKHVALTARGMALTQPGTHSFTSENCWQLAQVLMTQSESEEWLQALDEEATQINDASLNATYRNSLLAFLCPANVAKDNQR